MQVLGEVFSVVQGYAGRKQLRSGPHGSALFPVCLEVPTNTKRLSLATASGFPVHTLLNLQ